MENLYNEHKENDTEQCLAENLETGSLVVDDKEVVQLYESRNYSGALLCPFPTSMIVSKDKHMEEFVSLPDLEPCFTFGTPDFTIGKKSWPKSKTQSVNSLTSPSSSLQDFKSSDSNIIEAGSGRMNIMSFSSPDFSPEMALGSVISFPSDEDKEQTQNNLNSVSFSSSGDDSSSMPLPIFISTDKIPHLLSSWSASILSSFSSSFDTQSQYSSVVSDHYKVAYYHSEYNKNKVYTKLEHNDNATSLFDNGFRVVINPSVSSTQKSYKKNDKPPQVMDSVLSFNDTFNQLLNELQMEFDRHEEKFQSPSNTLLPSSGSSLSSFTHSQIQETPSHVPTQHIEGEKMTDQNQELLKAQYLISSIHSFINSHDKADEYSKRECLSLFKILVKDYLQLKKRSLYSEATRNMNDPTTESLLDTGELEKRDRKSCAQSVMRIGRKVCSFFCLHRVFEKNNRITGSINNTTPVGMVD